MAHKFLQPFIDLLFPPLCHACHEFIHDGRKLHLCDSCLETAVAIASPLCPLCGRGFPDSSGGDHLCGRCTTKPPSFTVARSALLFDGTTRNLIHQFKYSGKTLLRRPLAILTAERLDTFARECLPDLLLPVPLHKKRLQQRGFNQALLLGELFAKRWRIGLQRNNLRRIRWTEPQVNLSGVERHENVKGAFALADPAAIARQRILLVDDVYTTGSTVQECARVLIQGGAAAVTVITIARAAE